MNILGEPGYTVRHYTGGPLVSSLLVSDGNPGDLYQKAVATVFLEPPFRVGEIIAMSGFVSGENTDVAVNRNSGIFIATEAWFHPEDGDVEGFPGFRPDMLKATGAHNLGTVGLFATIWRRGRYQFSSPVYTPLYAKLIAYAASTQAEEGDECVIHDAGVAVTRYTPRP